MEYYPKNEFNFPLLNQISLSCLLPEINNRFLNLKTHQSLQSNLFTMYTRILNFICIEIYS